MYVVKLIQIENQNAETIQINQLVANIGTSIFGESCKIADWAILQENKISKCIKMLWTSSNKSKLRIIIPKSIIYENQKISADVPNILPIFYKKCCWFVHGEK